MKRRENVGRSSSRQTRSKAVPARVKIQNGRRSRPTLECSPILHTTFLLLLFLDDSINKARQMRSLLEQNGTNIQIGRNYRTGPVGRAE